MPYRRKALYLLLTIPMIGMYVAIAVMLGQASIIALVAYCCLFIMVAVCQSYVCAHLQCPYVGKFAPCVGGFCLPSSQIARLLKRARRSERAYKVAVSLASLAPVGIVLLPVPFLLKRSVVYLLAYVGIVVAYAAGFLWSICPACSTKHVCPGGRASTRLREMMARK